MLTKFVKENGMGSIARRAAPPSVADGYDEVKVRFVYAPYVHETSKLAKHGIVRILCHDSGLRQDFK